MPVNRYALLMGKVTAGNGSVDLWMICEADEPPPENVGCIRWELVDPLITEDEAMKRYGTTTVYEVHLPIN